MHEFHFFFEENPLFYYKESETATPAFSILTDNEGDSFLIERIDKVSFRFRILMVNGLRGMEPSIEDHDDLDGVKVINLSDEPTSETLDRLLVTYPDLIELVQK